MSCSHPILIAVVTRGGTMDVCLDERWNKLESCKGCEYNKRAEYAKQIEYYRSIFKQRRHDDGR